MHPQRASVQKSYQANLIIILIDSITHSIDDLWEEHLKEH